MRKLARTIKRKEGNLYVKKLEIYPPTSVHRPYLNPSSMKVQKQIIRQAGNCQC